VINESGPGYVREPRWPATLAVMIALVLNLAIPGRFAGGSVFRIVLPLLEASLLIPLTLTHPHRHHEETPRVRLASLSLIGLVSTANLVTLILLIRFLLSGQPISGTQLLFAAMLIWSTNVLAFALWYWESDGGGPGMRRHHSRRHPDFVFSQMTIPEFSEPGWQAAFTDYLYLSFTNATAFSPTDTLPMTTRAKMLMLVQSLASLITVGLVFSRAVNILK
jgi:uncharacterized membrane protein